MRIAAIGFSYTNKKSNSKIQNNNKQNVYSDTVSFSSLNIGKTLKTTEAGRSSKLLGEVLNSRLNIKKKYDSRLYVLTNSDLERTACSLDGFFEGQKLDGFRPRALEIIQDERIVFPLFIRKYSEDLEKPNPYFLLGIVGYDFNILNHKTNEFSRFFRGGNDMGAEVWNKMFIAKLDPIEFNPTINMKECMNYITVEDPDNFLKNNLPFLKKSQ